MKEEAAADLKDFLCINNFDIREQLLWIQWYHQWWFHSVIAYLSFVKADSAVKRKIFSLQQWQSIPWWTNHLIDIPCACVSAFLTVMIINSSMVKGDNILLVWQYHSPTVQSFCGNSGKLFICDNIQRACNSPKTFYGEGGKPFTCVAVTLTVRMILLWNVIISHWWLTDNSFIRNNVKLTQ